MSMDRQHLVPGFGKINIHHATVSHSFKQQCVHRVPACARGCVCHTCPPPLWLECGLLLTSESEFAQLCPTLCDPMDCSLPGSSVHGIFQAIFLEWIAISFSKRSSQPRDQTQVPHCRQTLYHLSHQGSPCQYHAVLVTVPL